MRDVARYRLRLWGDEKDPNDAYEVVFEELVNEGYYVLKERGGDPKHDIFFIVEV